MKLLILAIGFVSAFSQTPIASIQSPVNLQTPVATIQSSADFQIGGVSVVAAGVPRWPILTGDTVSAGASRAVVRFDDGSLVVLGPYAKVKVEEKDGLWVRLLEGAMSFTAAKLSQVRYTDGIATLHPAPGTAVTATAPRTASEGAATNAFQEPNPQGLTCTGTPTITPTGGEPVLEGICTWSRCACPNKRVVSCTGPAILKASTDMKGFLTCGVKGWTACGSCAPPPPPNPPPPPLSAK